MPYYCTVPRCTSLAGKTVNVSFHQFPRNPVLADKWNRILKRGKPYTKYSKVCSLHFTSDDYTVTSVGRNKGQWRTLRKDAIPSQNLPEYSPPPDPSRPLQVEENSAAEQQLHQQLAHAVYMQTIIAVHAASLAAAKNSGPSSDHEHDSDSDSEQQHQQTDSSEQNQQDCVSNDPSREEDPLSELSWKDRLQKMNGDPAEATHRCEECSKCFKDPDVLLLHKRLHVSDSANNATKEIINSMIKLSSEFDTRLLTNPLGLDPLNMEHQILLAMRMNMESYIKNITTFNNNGEKTESNVLETSE